MQTTLTSLAIAAALVCSSGQDVPLTKPDALVLEPGNHTIDDLIERSAKFLGRNYLVQATRSKRQPTEEQVTLQTRLELGGEACEEVIGQLLATCSLVLTPLDPARGIYEWVDCRQSSATVIERSAWMSLDDVLARSNLQMHVTTTLELRHISPAAAQALQAFFRDRYNMTRIAVLSSSIAPGPQGHAISRGGTVLLAGLAPVIARAIRVLRDADRAEGRALKPLEEQITALTARIKKLEGSKEGKDAKAVER